MWFGWAKFLLNGRFFLFNIKEGIDFKEKSQLLFSLLNTYILYKD